MSKRCIGLLVCSILWTLLTNGAILMAQDLDLATQDGLRLTLSNEGRVTACRVGDLRVPLSQPGGFAVFDAAGAEEGPNLVKNPSFEDGTEGWRLSATQSLDGEVAHTGKRSVRLHVAVPEKGSSNLGVRLPVKGGTLYKVGVWMRTKNCGVTSGYVSEFGADGKFSTDVTQIGLGRPREDEKWHFAGKVLQTHPKTTQLLLRADIYKSTGTLWLDDFTLIDLGSAQFTNVKGAAAKKGDGISFRSEMADQKLKLSAVFSPRPDCIQFDSEIEDTSGQDRAIVASFRLPFDAQGWTWFTDIEERQKIEDPGAYQYTYNCESGDGICSVYPFSALTCADAGLTLALPLSQGPRSFLISYDNNLKRYFINFYLGLTRRTAKFPQKATFSFVLYRHDPTWGMRSVVERYYKLYPESFKKRPTYEGYLNYANLERFDPKTHRLAGQGGTLDDASDFGEGYEFIWHMHGCYDFRMYHTEDTSMPSDEVVMKFLQWLVEREKEKPGYYCPTAETIKKLVYDVDGRIRYIGDTRYWKPREGYNHTDKPGWGLNFRVYESPEISVALAKMSEDKLEEYAKKHPGRKPFDACLTADAIEGYHTNTAGLDYRDEHIRVTTFPLTFGRENHKPAITNNIWDFQNAIWWPATERCRVVTYGNANGYEQTFTMPFCDIPMVEWDWDRTHPGRMERHMRTLAYQKIWRFWRTCGKGEEDPESVRWHFRRGLAYAFFPAVYPLMGNGMIEEYRHLYRKYVPAMEKLSAAGWAPIPYATSSDGSVVVERFGSFGKHNLHFTLRNYAQESKEVVIKLDPKGLQIGEVELQHLCALDLMSGKRTAVSNGSVIAKVEADGAAAFRVDTPEGRARYALAQADDGLRRIDRLFATELTEANKKAMDEAHGLIAQAAGADRTATLQAAEKIDGMLTEIGNAINTKATIDRSKIFFRIREELSDAARALLDVEALPSAGLLSGVRGETANGEVGLSNGGASDLDELDAAVLSPWDDAAKNSKIEGCPAKLPSGQNAALKLALAIPAQPERRLLPFLVQIKGKAQGVPFAIYSSIDVDAIPPLVIAPEPAKVHVGSPQKLCLKIENRTKDSASVTLKPTPPPGWTFDPAERPVAVKPGETASAEFAVALSEKAKLEATAIAVNIASDVPRFAGSETIRVTAAESVPDAAIQRTPEPPKIDGDLSDKCWQTEPTIPELVHIRSGKPVSEKTAVWLTYDSGGIYAAFRCVESNMGAIVAGMTERGSPIYREDDVEMFIVPTGAAMPMQFAVNPLGTQNDNIDNNKPWTAKAKMGQNEWTVEIFIPYSVLGVKEVPVLGAAWYIQVGRQQKPKSETSSWSTASKGFIDMDRMGKVSFR